MTGTLYVLRGLRLIWRPGLRRYVALPLAVNVILFAALILYAWIRFEDFLQWLQGFLPGWLQWLEWLLWPLFVLSLLVVLLYTFTIVANLIGAPFNGLLAEAVEQHLTGRRPDEQATSLKGWLIEAPRDLWAELRKVLYFLRWTVPFLFLFLVPGINVFAPFLWLAFSAWMLAVEYLDYPMGNHGIRFSEQRRRLRKRPMLSLSFGAGVLLLTLIPVLNFLAMPAAVAGATALWVEALAGDSSA
jgi:CysZ protein